VGAPFQGRCPASEVNDGGCPGKPDHLTILCHRDYLQRNLDAIDALIDSGAKLSSLKVHWWRKLLVISELHRQQTILLYSKTRSIPDRIVNLV
jgi:hypothetical protein